MFFSVLVSPSAFVQANPTQNFAMYCMLYTTVQHATKQKEASGTEAKDLTEDEKKNAHLRSIARAILKSIAIELEHASIIISGAGSEFVKETREQHDPRETNIILAKLPKHKRALTVVGVDEISIYCSNDAKCNLMICFAGLQVRVGSTVSGVMSSASELIYDWHTLAHPFDVVLQLNGLIHLLVWALNYDHHWTKRTLGLDISASEVAVSLSPIHLQTVLLHLDNFIDPLSSFNEW